MIIEIAGQDVEIPRIVTGLTKDPWQCEPVEPKRHALNRIELEELPKCQAHPHYRGFAQPDWRCGRCWDNYGRVLRNDYQRRAARRK